MCVDACITYEKSGQSSSSIPDVGRCVSVGGIRDTKAYKEVQNHRFPGFLCQNSKSSDHFQLGREEHRKELPAGCCTIGKWDSELAKSLNLEYLERAAPKADHQKLCIISISAPSKNLDRRFFFGCHGYERKRAQALSRKYV